MVTCNNTSIKLYVFESTRVHCSYIQQNCLKFVFINCPNNWYWLLYTSLLYVSSNITESALFTCTFSLVFSRDRPSAGIFITHNNKCLRPYVTHESMCCNNFFDPSGSMTPKPLVLEISPRPWEVLRCNFISFHYLPWKVIEILQFPCSNSGLTAKGHQLDCFDFHRHLQVLYLSEAYFCLPK